MKVLCVQHVPFETPGAIRDWAEGRGYTIACFEPSSGEPFPSTDSFDLLLLMGGPMSVYEEDLYPWLVEEKRFIREAIARDRHVLGICLGAQLIAAAMGANVYAGAQKEIGWFPIRLTSEGRCSDLFGRLDPEFCPLHWHGDTFDLPEGAVLLAGSALYPNQAFYLGPRVIGMQFHLEMRPAELRGLIESCGNELVHDESIQSGEQMLEQPARFARANAVLFTLLDRWLPLR